MVINSVSSVDAGEKLATELGDAVYVQSDVGGPLTARALVDAALERWSRVDGVADNAGVTVPVPLAAVEALTVDHWNTVLTTNVIGTFVVCQAARPSLRATGEG